MTATAHRTALIVASADTGRLEPGPLEELRGYDDALVVAPASAPPQARWLIDEDEAVRLAAARGEVVARRLRAAGLPATVVVGDPDPAQAVRDARHRLGSEFLRMPTATAA